MFASFSFHFFPACRLLVLFHSLSMYMSVANTLSSRPYLLNIFPTIGLPASHTSFVYFRIFGYAFDLIASAYVAQIFRHHPSSSCLRFTVMHSLALHTHDNNKWVLWHILISSFTCKSDANLIRRRNENKKFPNHFQVNQRIKSTCMHFVVVGEENAHRPGSNI